MKNIFLFIFLIVAGLSFSQSIFLTDADYSPGNPLNCGAIVSAGGTNFSDGAGNYLPNTNETLVLCPDLTQGSKVSIAFGVNIGYEFDVHPSDTIYIYDGPSTSAPLLGAYNSATNPNGFYVAASFENNPTGCLTLVFHSDGANEGTGWVANVACGNLPQPYYPHITALKNGTGQNILNPLDTGYVDICLGDSILFTATPLFPYSLESTGTGYAQNAGNCTYQWTISGVGQFNTSSFWFKPTQRVGYYVDLRMTDPFPQIKRLTCKVRVSQQPLFPGTGPLLPAVCLGNNTVLVGGVTQTDTVGVDVPGSEFQIGGTFAGLTALPDGSGAQYTTNIFISGFDSTATITSATDIDQICLDMEHSYIGDLEIALRCPNGTMVSLMNAYNGLTGMINGGCGSGISTSIGNDTDNDGGAPGSPVWSYCFSPNNATFGTLCAEVQGGNTVANSSGDQAANPNGVYLPDGNFNDFVGCPINGNWSIVVRDNQSIDDGYIFQWGIYFNSSLYPDMEGYQNTITSSYWNPDPSIVSSGIDTLIIIQPDVLGNTYYTYNVVDNFGCHYDTVVALFVIPHATIDVDSLICSSTYAVQGTTTYNGGTWSSPDSFISFSSTTSNNPVISTSGAGLFTVQFVDNTCNDTLIQQMEFPPTLAVVVNDTINCIGAQTSLFANSSYTTPLQPGYSCPSMYAWSNGVTTQLMSTSQEGTYTVTYSNVCYSVTDVGVLTSKPCDITVPNVIVLSSEVGNDVFFVNYNGIQTFYCVITNRWGNVIYEYTDPAGGWDGKTTDGKLCTEGTYFYRIEGEFEGAIPFKKHGFVELKY
ncbi:MAG: hypothetical protein RL264_1476 [Bacteroidota bacterium]|jgi:subtilisin-like proprotein convertase family protein